MNSHDKYLIGGAEAAYDAQALRGERIDEIATSYLKEIKAGREKNWTDWLDPSDVTFIVEQIYPPIAQAAQISLVRDFTSAASLAIAACASSSGLLEALAQRAAKGYAETRVDQIDWDDDDSDDDCDYRRDVA